jgi:hypothetical protein
MATTHVDCRGEMRPLAFLNPGEFLGTNPTELRNWQPIASTVRLPIETNPLRTSFAVVFLASLGWTNSVLRPFGRVWTWVSHSLMGLADRFGRWVSAGLVKGIRLL